MKDIRILMVCLGNIYRSPMAEGVLDQHLLKHGINARVDSCGTSGWHEGEKPDKRAIHVANARGIDISQQRSRPFTLTDFDAFDLIFAMDYQNRRDLFALAKTEEHRKKIHLYLEFAGYDAPTDVPDPYYGNEADFYRVYDLLDATAEAVTQRIMTEFQST